MPTRKDSRGRWVYQFQLDGKRYYGTAPKANNTQKVAAALERDLIDKLSRQQFTGVMPTVAEFGTRFLDYQKQHTKPLTHELQETVVRLHVTPHVGKLRLDALDRLQLDALKTKWSEAGAASTTINARLDVVRRMLTLAVEWGFLVAAPKVARKKVAKQHPRWLDDADSFKLLEAAKEYDEKGAPLHGVEKRTKRRRSNALKWRTMVLVGLRTGLRIGELRGLTWIDVDLDRDKPVVHVRRTDPGRGDLDPNDPKGNRPRTVPLTDETRAELAAWKAASEHRRAGDWVFPGPSSWRAERDRRRTRSSTACNAAMAAVAAIAGFKEEDDVSWHTLRHTYASQLVARGVSLRVVQALLGHASITMTEVYAHLAPNATHHDAVKGLDFAVVQAIDVPTTPRLPPAADDPECKQAANEVLEPPGSRKPDA